MLNINEIGILAFGTRMKRLYDYIIPEGKAVYRAHNLDFDPKWFTIIYALVENQELSVTDLAKALGLAHPSIIQNLRELEKNGWVVSKKSKNDGRIRLICLSDEAKKRVPELQKVWGYMRQALEELNRDGQVDFWEGFLEFEAAVMKKSWKDRVMEISGKAQRKSTGRPKATHPGLWFERKFDFENLSTTPEGILERLRFTPLRLQEQIKNLSHAQLTQTFENKWSVQENIGHMNDLEPLWHGRILDILNGAKTMRPADLTNKKSHEAEHDEVPIDKILSDFFANRKKLVALCEKNIEMAWTASAIHPRLLKPMRIIDLLYFTAEHDDHHIATINYLIHQF
ncbi:MAG TPA: MarR family transcriptional regulator [Bacteroidetes bacterium]|nr:MarR family transcriptional regulator [Bacteroidota bacterium]